MYKRQVVSTNLTKAIAENYKLKYIETLTGFKYIGEQILLFEKNNTYKFIFGMEESFGCLVGDYTRDKDACAAVVILCEIAAFYKLQGETICNAMEEVYRKYGYYFEGAFGITLKGVDGAAQIKEMMENFRNHPLTTFAGIKVTGMRDYVSGIRKPLDGEEEHMGLPKSNVLYYELENNAWFAVRPSGNEPKIKFYFGVNENSLKNAMSKIDEMKACVQELVK